MSGAIYGLLAGGQNAFRREPELADRQQNIRVAMDLISRDVFNAGAALPTFSQIFTRDRPARGACTGAGPNGCGPGTMGPDGRGGPRRRGPLENTDVREIVASDEQCPVQTASAARPPPGRRPRRHP